MSAYISTRTLWKAPRNLITMALVVGGWGTGQGLKVEKEVSLVYILFCFIFDLNVRTTEKIKLKIDAMGLPWWYSGWESACQCKGHRFDS